jgi:hypothetical protein
VENRQNPDPQSTGRHQSGTRFGLDDVRGKQVENPLDLHGRRMPEYRYECDIEPEIRHDPFGLLRLDSPGRSGEDETERPCP